MRHLCMYRYNSMDLKNTARRSWITRYRVPFSNRYRYQGGTELGWLQRNVYSRVPGILPVTVLS